MFSLSTIITFLTASIAIILAPGPAQTLVLARSMNDGVKAGIQTAVGLNIATLVYAVATALGLSAVLAASKVAFLSVKFLGAFYLFYLGVKAFLENPHGEISGEGTSSPQAMTKAIITGILNPKVALFFVAFLPQFVEPERGSVFLQFLILGILVAMLDIIYESLLAAIAGAASSWLVGNPKFNAWKQRITGTVLIALGLRLVFI
jgi:threonine/homoserine/homoserine lactone efflux protein